MFTGRLCKSVYSVVVSDRPILVGLEALVDHFDKGAQQDLFPLRQAFIT